MLQSSVTDSAQTSDGYLWVGTLATRVAHFDGKRFVPFDLANTLPLGHPGVRRLFGDSFGRLWINTFGPGLLIWEFCTAPGFAGWRRFRAAYIDSVGGPTFRMPLRR